MITWQLVFLASSFYINTGGTRKKKPLTGKSPELLIIKISWIAEN